MSFSLSHRRAYYRLRNNAALWSKLAVLGVIAVYVTARLMR